MPMESCSEGGKSGYRWGTHGKCYTYSNNPASKARAKKACMKQAAAIEISKHAHGSQINAFLQHETIIAFLQKEFGDDCNDINLKELVAECKTSPSSQDYTTALIQNLDSQTPKG